MVIYVPKLMIVGRRQTKSGGPQGGRGWGGSGEDCRTGLLREAVSRIETAADRSSDPEVRPVWIGASRGAARRQGRCRGPIRVLADEDGGDAGGFSPDIALGPDAALADEDDEGGPRSAEAGVRSRVGGREPVEVPVVDPDRSAPPRRGRAGDWPGRGLDQGRPFPFPGRGRAGARLVVVEDLGDQQDRRRPRPSGPDDLVRVDRKSLRQAGRDGDRGLIRARYDRCP